MADNNVYFVAGNICRHLACALDQSKVMAAAREIAAHFAAQGQDAEPIYQIKLHYDTVATWRDCSREAYDLHPEGKRRIVYAHPPSAQDEPVSGADGLPKTVRKAFVCSGCHGVYADTPVTSCDCMEVDGSFIEGTITYPTTQPSGNAGEPIADDTSAAILADSSYINGLRTGYVLGQAGNEEAYQMIITNTRALINEARGDLRDGSKPSGSAGEFTTDDQMGFVLAAIQYYGSQKWAEGRGLASADLLNVREAWDAAYAAVQALAAQAQPPVSQPTPNVTRIARDTIRNVPGFEQIGAALEAAITTSGQQPHTWNTFDAMVWAWQAALAQQAAPAWTGNTSADAALVMLDRLDIRGDGDDARVDEIAATIRRLVQQPIGQNREDAERYRHVRRRIGAERTNGGKGPVSYYLLMRTPASDALAAETDAAIDADRAAVKEQS